MIDILNKRYTDPRFINNDYLTFLTFFQKLFFTFLAILFLEVTMWSTRFSHPKETTP